MHLVVVEAGVSHQHPHYQPGQLVLQHRPVSLINAGGEPLQTSVDIQHNCRDFIVLRKKDILRGAPCLHTLIILGMLREFLIGQDSRGFK